jgi:hypothetical protein
MLLVLNFGTRFLKKKIALNTNFGMYVRPHTLKKKYSDNLGQIPWMNFYFYFGQGYHG